MTIRVLLTTIFAAFCGAASHAGDVRGSGAVGQMTLIITDSAQFRSLGSMRPDYFDADTIVLGSYLEGRYRVMRRLAGPRIGRGPHRIRFLSSTLITGSPAMLMLVRRAAGGHLEAYWWTVVERGQACIPRGVAEEHRLVFHQRPSLQGERLCWATRELARR